MTERRWNPKTAAPTPALRCRVCFRGVKVDAQRIEETVVHIYYRCEHCNCSFPIRREDAEAIQAAAAEAH